MARIGGLSTKNAPRPVNAPTRDGRQSMKLTSEDKSLLLDFVPVVGDIKGAYETVDMISDELEKDEPNYRLIGILGGVGAVATIIGLVPGIGDVAQKAIMAGARSVADSASKLGKGALDLPKRAEVDPDALGALGDIDLQTQYNNLKTERDELISQATKDKTFFGDEVYDLDSTMSDLADQINDAGLKPSMAGLERQSQAAGNYSLSSQGYPDNLKEEDKAFIIQRMMELSNEANNPYLKGETGFPMLLKERYGR
tara:strand:- start:30 stop:794 length:765 start_codon:yes stop_codon:yes gene_type:complete